ncbi:acyl-homoserine-lactone synthase [Nitratireductor sp. XY-223]|uniref:acyl-homoserine-lactone synthase n=1 Tax=Nitratireductor sp. XY-223 TaxID=2561926 RepID=UPI0010AAB4F1|nr:acyl-homoserine-lactone synthase [Nitratireductor sp. XY-223]
MIRVINGYEAGRHSDVVDQMHRIRAQVFSDRPQWDARVNNGREIDRFDKEDPLYLVSIDESSKQVQGSVRLMPTTGPNMLRDVFRELLEDGLAVESPVIWESSRFSVNPDLSHRTDDGTSKPLPNRVTTELLLGMVEVAQLAGIRFVVSVFDARTVRMFRAADCPAEILGKGKKFGRVMTYVGLFEINDNLRSRIATAGSIDGSVLEKQFPEKPIEVA